MFGDPGVGAYGVGGDGTGAPGSGVPGVWGRRAEGLAETLDGLLAVDPDELGDGKLAEAMVGLRRAQARLAAAVVAGMTAVFEAREATPAGRSARPAASGPCQ